MRLFTSRQYCWSASLIIAGAVGTWIVAPAGAQTRPVPASPAPQTRPTPAARATPLGQAAPAPLKIKMFQPGNFPPATTLGFEGGGALLQELTVAERQQIFSLTNGPQISLSLAHIFEPNKANLRVVSPLYVGDGAIKVGTIAAHQQQSYVCLDLYADPNKTYFVDMMFETGASGAGWDIYGPDSKADLIFPPEVRGKITHLTFGFANSAKAGKFLFQMAPRQDTNVYRLDIYVK
jgi:hypothetical protein